MADKKISELVELTSLATDDVLPVVDTGANATKRITAANLSKFPAGVTIPNGSTIGSASDPDAISIAAGGDVTFSQNIVMAAGKGIDFSAYGAGATIDTNLLDDYEEGTWTPVYTPTISGSFTMNANTNGRYTKVGNMVSLYVYMLTDSASSPVGNVRITGIPFATSSLDGTSLRFGGGIGMVRAWATDMPNLKIESYGGQSFLRLFKNATNSAGQTELSASDLDTGAGDNFLTFSFTYMTDA